MTPDSIDLIHVTSAESARGSLATYWYYIWSTPRIVNSLSTFRVLVANIPLTTCILGVEQLVYVILAPFARLNDRKPPSFSGLVYTAL